MKITFQKTVKYCLYTTLVASHLLIINSLQAAPAECQKSTQFDTTQGGYTCKGWYAGIGLGASFLEPNIINLPETLDKTNDTVLPTIFLGYDLNAQWGLEAHYSNQGQATFNSGAAIDYSHAGASVLYHFKNHLPGWNIYGKLGASQLSTKLAQGRDDGGVFNFEQVNSTQAHAGVGAEYMTKSHWGLRLEGLIVDSDSQEITLSLLKRFGRSVPAVKAAPIIIATPEPKPKPKPTPEICNAPMGVLEGIYFVSASARLTTQSKAVLDNIASQLLPFPAIELAVRAHTDSQGSDTYNLSLSQNRAISVRNFLHSRGINNIQSQGHGETRPIGDNNTAQGRAQNRRVEIEVLSDECES